MTLPQPPILSAKYQITILTCLVRNRTRQATCQSVCGHASNSVRPETHHYASSCFAPTFRLYDVKTIACTRKCSDILLLCLNIEQIHPKCRRLFFLLDIQLLLYELLTVSNGFGHVIFSEFLMIWKILTVVFSRLL